MTHRTRQEYTAILRAQYAQADKEGEGQMLGDSCRTARRHRKAAIRALRRVPGAPQHPPGRPHRCGPALVPLPEQLWDIGGQLCGKLLAPGLPILIAALERHRALALTAEQRAHLLRLSPATVDRLLWPRRARRGRQRRGPVGPRALVAAQRSPSGRGRSGRARRPGPSRAVSPCTAASRPPASISPPCSSWMSPRAGPSWSRPGASGTTAPAPFGPRLPVAPRG